MSRKIVAKNVLSMVLAQAINIIAPFLVLPFLARELCVDEFSKAILMLTICSLCYVVTDYGFNVSNTYQISKNRNNFKFINSLISNSYFIKVLILAGTLVVLATLSIFGDYEASYIAWVFLAITAMSFQPLWFFQGIEKMHWATAVFAISKVGYAFLVLIFVSENSDAGTVAMFFAIANIIGAVLALYVIYSQGFRFTPPNLIQVKKLLVDGKGYFSTKMIVAIYNYSNVLFANMFIGGKSVAYYGVGEKLYNVVQSASSPIAMALYPYFSVKRDYKLLYVTLFGLSLVGIPAVIIVWAYAEAIIGFIYGENYIHQADVIRYFAIAGYFSVLNAISGYPAFALLNKPELANKSAYVGFVVYLLAISNLFFFSCWSVLNLVKIVILVEFSVFIVRTLLFRREIKSVER